jgi:oligopeptide/dipeptide ABC transporter ATP-binding protein
VLEVSGLRTVFSTQDGEVHAVNGVSFSLRPGELLGVVGESGSGKSVTMMSLLKLLPMPPARIVEGSVKLMGRDLLRLPENELRDVRGGSVGFVFQDPMTSLNPVLTVGYQLIEPLRVHMGLSKTAARTRAAELLALVGIPQPAARLNDYPHQFSGGMRQRVMIAMALACDPKVLIADEPTTALDVTIQAQILDLIRELRRELGMAIVWVTHDLGVVAGIADRVMVMYGGQVVEMAPVEALFADPRHPYTRALLETLPSLDGERTERLRSISGQPPHLGAPPSSCPFAPRCRHVMDRCRAQNPALRPVSGGHDVACWWDATTDAPAWPMRWRGTPVPEAATALRPATETEALVRVEGLTKHFPILAGLLRRQVGVISAVDDLTFDIRKGETLGLVGESGCGKSTAGRTILRLYEATAGRILFEGTDIASLSGEALRRMRPRMQMIFQDPQACLNPRMTVGSIIAEPLDEQERMSLPRSARRCRRFWPRSA